MRRSEEGRRAGELLRDRSCRLSEKREAGRAGAAAQLRGDVATLKSASHIKSSISINLSSARSSLHHHPPPHDSNAQDPDSPPYSSTRLSCLAPSRATRMSTGVALGQDSPPTIACADLPSPVAVRPLDLLCPVSAYYCTVHA